MKKIFLGLIFLLNTTILLAQSNGVFNTVTTKDSFRLGRNWINEISLDGTFINAKDGIIPTQKAVKTYIDSRVIPPIKISNISTLRQTTGVSIFSVELLGYYNTGDGGEGSFYWNDTSTLADNGGTIIKVNNIQNGRWIRSIPNDEINVKWFGAKGNGVDDTEPVRRAFNSLKATVAGGGGRILFPAGDYILDSIYVNAGVDIYSKQLARDNYIPYVRSRIRPKPGTPWVFYFADDAKNSTMSGIYIDGDFENNPNLKAAVRWAGSFNAIEKCSFTRCAQAAIISDCGAMILRDNLLAGWSGPAPTFTGLDDFRGTLQINNVGDSYISNNEISGGIPYFDKRGMLMLRDSINGRICAMVIKGQGGTSWISGNFFENGDRAVVIHAGVYGHFYENRYELSGMGGLLIKGSAYFFTFTSERFADNGLGESGRFSDIELEPGAIGYANFNNITFQKIYSSIIPESNNKMKYNFNNRASSEVSLINPLIDTGYVTKSVLNEETNDHQPTKQVDQQISPKNPIYNNIRIGWNGNNTLFTLDTTIRGGVDILRGSSKADGGYPGSIRFFDAWENPVAQVSFDGAFNLSWTLYRENARFIFGGGDILNAKNGGSSLTLQSNDGNGENTIRFLGNTAQSITATMSLSSETGIFNILASGDMEIYAKSLTLVGGNVVVAKSNDILIGTISDGTGTSIFKMSSNSNADNAFQISMNNTNGLTKLTSSNDLILGGTGDGTIRIKPNGLLSIPFTPTTSINLNDKSFLLRDNITSEVQIIDGSTVNLTPTLDYVTNNGNSTTHSIVSTGTNPTNNDGLHIYANNLFSGNPTTGTKLPLTINSAALNINSSNTININAGTNDINIGTAGVGFGSNLKIGNLSAELEVGNSGLHIARIQTWTNGVDAGGIKILDFFNKGAVYEADYSAAGVLDDLWIPSWGAVKKKVGNYGSIALSGDGTTTTFNIPHGIGTTPTYIDAKAGSADASNIKYRYANATNIIVVFDTPPPSGTNNLIFYWEAKL